MNRLLVHHARVPRRTNKRFRHSSTHVWGASTKSDGRGRSEMKICGSERILRRKWGWIRRYCGGSGAGSADTAEEVGLDPQILRRKWGWIRRYCGGSGAGSADTAEEVGLDPQILRRKWGWIRRYCGGSGAGSADTAEEVGLDPQILRRKWGWIRRYCGGSGAGSDTPSGSQNPAPHAKP